MHLTGEIKKFLRRIPRDPVTEDGECVYDIYCLSDKQALDGTYYADW